jgi:hypothetical protein
MRVQSRWQPTDVLTALLLFALSWTVYALGPVAWILDSDHTLLLSEQIYSEGNLQLDQYFPDFQPEEKPSDYRLEWRNGHLYYVYPPGSSVLSVPYVALSRLFGYSPLGPDGLPSFENEEGLQVFLAGLLTSLFVLLVFVLARGLLPLSWSVFISLAMAFGTMALSTTSRALWSHTWGILLLAVTVWVCWRRMETGWTPLMVALVATLLSWCYLVRPTFALSAVGITVFAALQRARYWWLLPVVGLMWLVLFAALSHEHLGTWLPIYFSGNKLQLSGMAEGLAGTLVSPSRGLLFFTPGLLCWIYFAVVYWSSLRRRPWLVLAVSVVAAHWLVASANHLWWAGHSFGPRLMTDVLPWIAVLGVLATKAWLDGRQSGRPRRRRIELIALIVLWAVSVAMHAPGAFSFHAKGWNPRPLNVDFHHERLWEWSDPQSLRAYQESVSLVLDADPREVSVGAGGTQHLYVSAGKANASRRYWILGSVTGTAPGVTLFSRVKPVNLPLNPDRWTDYTISFANTVLLRNTKGRLDASGYAEAAIDIPKINLPGAIGLVLYHACLIYDDDHDFHMTSDPMPLKLVK